MNKKFSFDQIQTMDDVQKVDFKPCETQYEIIMSNDFYIAFEKVLKLTGRYSEEEIQDFLRILAKIRASEELLYTEGTRFHKLLDDPTFQKIGNAFARNLIKRMLSFIRHVYGKDFDDSLTKDLDKNLSTQKIISKMKAAIEQTFLTPQQMKKLTSLTGLKDLEGNVGGLYSQYTEGGIIYGNRESIDSPLLIIAKEKGDYVELFECLHQAGKGKIITGEYDNNTLVQAINAQNTKIVKYLLQHIQGWKKFAEAKETVDPEIRAALEEYGLLDVRKDDENKDKE